LNLEKSVFIRLLLPGILAGVSRQLPYAKSTVYLVFFLAAFLRLVLIPHPGFLADIAYWKWWTRDSADHGLVHTITSTGINYPPLYLVVMKVTGHVYSLFADAHNEAAYFDKSNLLFLFLIKLPYIAADLIIGYIIYSSLRNQFKFKTLSLSFLNLPLNLDLPLVAAGLWLFNPGVIYDSALWGQTDSLGVIPILLAFIVALADRPLLAGALAGVAFFLKAQSIPLIILLYAYLLLRYGLPKTIRSAAAAFTTGLVVTSPFYLSHTMDRIISTILSSIGYFPWASLYAFNLWWLVIKGVNFQYPDQTLLWGIASFRTVGFTLFWITFAVLVVALWQAMRRQPSGLPDRRSLFSTATLLTLAAFLLPTEIHERYLLPFFAFAPLAIFSLLENYLPTSANHQGVSPTFNHVGRLTDEVPPAIWVLRNKPLAISLLSYAVISISWFLNLHFVMIKNYPENEQPGLSLITPHLQNLSLLLSAANLFFFGGLLFIFLRPFISRKLAVMFLALPLVIFAGLAVVPKLSTVASMVRLTTLKPVFAIQGWGNLGVNKSVGGNNLSTDFYYSWNGLGTHALSHIDYNVNGRYSRLETEVGVDTEAGDPASVEFQIYGDGKQLVRSGVMKKWEPPKFLSANITGIKTLTLVVTDGGDGPNNDHADWINPILYK
jgi:Gpi18-like mannosyltransferase